MRCITHTHTHTHTNAPVSLLDVHRVYTCSLPALPGWRGTDPTTDTGAGAAGAGEPTSEVNCHLRVLSAHHNHLMRLPSWVNDCSSLEELRLSHNNLNALPVGFGRIPPYSDANDDANDDDNDDDNDGS